MKTFSIILPRAIAYIKKVRLVNHWMHYVIENDELIEKHDYIWNKVNNSTKNKIYVKFFYNKKIRQPK